MGDSQSTQPGSVARRSLIARDPNRFLRPADLDSEIIDRLSRYEAALWRQLAQTLFTLQALKRR